MRKIGAKKSLQTALSVIANRVAKNENKLGTK
jgi:hypothetical protein